MTDYDLSKSKQKLGPLYPILKDAHGNIIDGFHREQADPTWPTLTLGNIDNPVKLELSRLAANFLRRNVPASEIQGRIAFLIVSGLKPEDIAEQTGLSVATVYRYMPQDKKNPVKVKAGKISGSVRTCEQTVTTQDTTPKRLGSNIHDQLVSNIVLCDHCRHDTYISQLKTLDVCPNCYELLRKCKK